MYFGMEHVHGNDPSGTAHCFLLVALPSMPNALDTECATITDSQGNPLGDASRGSFAVYSATIKKCSNMDIALGPFPMPMLLPWMSMLPGEPQFQMLWVKDQAGGQDATPPRITCPPKIALPGSLDRAAEGVEGVRLNTQQVSGVLKNTTHIMLTWIPNNLTTGSALLVIAEEPNVITASGETQTPTAFILFLFFLFGHFGVTELVFVFSRCSGNRLEPNSLLAH